MLNSVHWTQFFFSFIVCSRNLQLQGWQMVPRKLQVLETFHSISKSQNSVCNESQSLVFVSFLESWIFELFEVKSQIFKQGLGEPRILPFTTPS